MTPTIEWSSLELMKGDQLKTVVFNIFQDVSRAINIYPTDNPQVLESVPRLASLIEANSELKSFKEPFNALARATGLWNYIDKESADTQEALIAESVTLEELDGLTLHREQVAALNALLSGKNLILSAPTSFGKSLLIDALIASKKYRRIAIVLPTIALLDEFRRRLRRRFRDTFKIIMHPTEHADTNGTGTGRVIFLGTQERLITRNDLGNLDLTVVDEFYKLDPSRKDDRSVTLNAAVYKLLGNSKQFFFLGPNIDGVRVASDGRWNFEFLRTRFSTVAVDTFDLTSVKNKQEALFDEIADDANWPALVFVSSPDKANKLAALAARDLAVSDTSADFARWISENIGKKSGLHETVRFGFGLHHGRLPRAIAAQMVRMFNQKDLPVLFCTSTLIEGVNTAAKTVLIFDKAISRSNYDFFTFSNIRGRAGRLGEHHVGRVYLFNSPPSEEATEVAPTLFSEEDDAPLEYVVQLNDQEQRSTSARVDNLMNTIGLGREDLKIAASIGVEKAYNLRRAVYQQMDISRVLAWSNYPDYPQIKTTIEMICKVKSPSEFGARSASQLSYFVSRLRQAKTMKEFLIEYDDKFAGDISGHDNIFKFLRACEYGLSQAFAVVEVFVKQRSPNVDYSFFIQGLSRWFRAEELKNLDEEGVPIQISERFWQQGDDRQRLERKLRTALKSAAGLSEFEREWLKQVLDN